MNTIQLINDFKKNNSMLWVEAGNIKLFVADGFENSAGVLATIREFKPQIVDFLTFNGIFSKDDFQQRTIFKSPGNEAVLSFAQQRLWFIELYEQGSNAYHIPLVIELDADMDTEGVKYALRQIVARHEVLRSTIEHGEGGEHGRQRVHDEPLVIEEIAADSEEEFKLLIEEAINRPFDLSGGYPVRAVLYTIPSAPGTPDHSLHRTVLLVNFHHIASDGWSIDIFQKEWSAYYDAYCSGDGAFELPPLEIQYKDYAVWQRAYLADGIMDKQLRYWKNKLSGYQTLELPVDHLRPAEIDYRGSHQEFPMGEAVSRRLRALAQQHGATLYSVMLSSINILLSKYSGQEDIVTGSVIANRHHRQTEGLIGFFVNTQVNRALLSPPQTFAELIHQVHEDQVEAQQYQDLPFEKLVEELGAERDLSRHPVFQVMFGFESFGARSKDAADAPAAPKSLPGQVDYDVEKFDLSVNIDDSGEELMGQITYATALFDDDTIAVMISRYLLLLQQLTDAPDIPYSKHSLLSAAEYRQTVEEWTASHSDYPADKTIDQVFQAQAEKTPDNIALVYEGQRLTYRQLNEKANCLARHIRSQYQERTQRPLTPDTLIPLYLDRSLEMVIGILAVLKAGAAYVPMDIYHPQDRIDYLLNDTAAALILTQRQLNEGNSIQLPEAKLVYADLDAAFYQDEDMTNLPPHGDASSLAYLIYTSGSTGKPKAVAVEHRPVVNMAWSRVLEYQMVETENSLQIASICFDASVEQIFTALFCGATLTLIKKETLIDGKKCEQFFNEQKITHLDTVPSFLETLDFSKLSSLKRIASGGEACTAELVNRILPYMEFYNEYGPTEATVIATQYKIAKGTKVAETIPIGRPIANATIFILDNYLQLVPPGIAGEIFIGGDILARGYFNSPELTAQRFVPNPFGGGRLYKTGDLGKWRKDGQVEYLGRKDNQVKIRGFRIELGEIEQALAQISGVRQCCVLAKERKTASGNDKYLAAYYVPENSDEPPSQSYLLDTLSQLLPEYMVPAAFVALPSFPMTINDKLDTRALPDPDLGTAADDYVAPATPAEAALCGIWQSVLGLERVGITDNFFRIGGNSILAIQVSHRMSTALRCDVKVADIFRHKTIAQLIRNSLGEMQVVIPKTESRTAVLSFAQERLWFIEQYEQGTHAYHIPEVLELDDETDIAGIKYALQQIVARHEVLRTTVEQGEDDTHGIQRVHDEPLTFEEAVLTSGEDMGARIREAISRPFDLSTSYPIRVTFYTVPAEVTATGHQLSRTLLLINTHHIASDAWSGEIFQRELFAYYEAWCNDDLEFSLPEPEIQYKDYAVWQRQYFTGDVLEHQLRYWKQKLSGFQTLELPTDYTRPAETDYNGSAVAFRLGVATSEHVRALAQQLGVTVNSVLLAGMNILLGKYTGQDDIVTGSVTANRHHRQTEGLIGFFVNTQANRALLNDNQSFEELALQVHQEQVAAQQYQDLPFEKLVDELGVERDPSRHPVFQLMFIVNSIGGHYDGDGEQQQLAPFKTEDIYAVEKFDLSIFIEDGRQEITGAVSYATALFHRATIQRFIEHYLYLLEQLGQAPQQQYSTISLLKPEARAAIIDAWNRTDTNERLDKTVAELFAEQAANTPGAVALVFEGKRLSYRELDEKSNQLARHIQAQYMQRTQQSLVPGSMIALYLSRGFEMVTAILAVMKAGGAYVPIDVNFPQERVDYLLTDTGAGLILTQQEFAATHHTGLPQERVVYIDFSNSCYQQEDTAALPQHPAVNDLACVLFTSGTTGKPKGVMMPHITLSNRVLYMMSRSGITAADHYLFKTNYVFDVSITDIFTHLCAGATLYVTQHVFDLDALNGLLTGHPFTSLHLVPSQYELLAATISTLPLQKIYFSGEAMTAKILSDLNRNIKVFNYYGPTETGEVTVFSPATPAEASVIGNLFPNCRQYVLDRSGNPVPVGVTGELYLGGACLAQGYLHQPELTAERFIANPFATAADIAKGYTRLYKTGDLVRWLPDGSLQYIGRNDNQVKINGYRIELAEIEQGLLQIAGIGQSCVLAKTVETESGAISYLVGYYVGDGKQSTPSETDIFERLSQMLPEYMVPSALVEMDAFPLTGNGKLDKTALPDPGFETDEDAYTAPVTETEVTMCNIWKEALRLERVGITDNFFRIGGNSILAIQVSHRMSKALGCDIKVADVFKLKNIQMLLANISVRQVSADNVEWDV